MFGLFKKKEQSNPVVELLSEYAAWADDVRTPKAMSDLLDSLNETCHAIFGTGLKMSVTESEFNRLSLDSARTLVKEAIGTLQSHITERNR